MEPGFLPRLFAFGPRQNGDLTVCTRPQTHLTRDMMLDLVCIGVHIDMREV
jgi:hypothetical protein